jgi:hypothetical protein
MNNRRLRRRVHFACMIVIALLYLLSVPWYRDSEAPLRLWLGLPDWVAMALLCYVGVAVVNAIAWIVSDVSDEPDPSRETEAPR